ncbi:hypothetical protein [Acinetobacter thermotolerans]
MDKKENDFSRKGVFFGVYFIAESLDFTDLHDRKNDHLKFGRNI